MVPAGSPARGDLFIAPDHVSFFVLQRRGGGLVRGGLIIRIAAAPLQNKTTNKRRPSYLQITLTGLPPLSNAERMNHDLARSRAFNIRS